MISQFGFVSEDNFSEKMDTQNALLLALVEAQGGTAKPTSWANVQALVRAGLHKKVFAIGDQLVCQKGGSDLTWDIIGFDCDTPTDSQFTHSLTLQLHDCLANTMQFDAPEALYYAENGLAAGTYNFTLPDGYDTGAGGGKTYQFTLESDVPEGGQLTFGWGYGVQAANAKITSYSGASSTTQIEQVSVTEGSGGTSLGIADGTSTNLNEIKKTRFGSNNYSQSAIRQFLNSSAAAGSVWTSKNNFDRPPSWNSSTAGFMNGIDSDFLAVVGIANKVTAISTPNGGGSVTLNDKFFLLSRSEVFGGLENDINEGSPYPYYKDYSDLSAAGTSADTNRKKYKGGSVQKWWLRSPNSNVTATNRDVPDTGEINYSFVYLNGGICPACVII